MSGTADDIPFNMADYDSKKFEAALGMVMDREKHDYSAVIDGLNIASGTDFPLVSPVDDTIIFGTLQQPEPGTARVAAESAAKAFEAWSKEDPADRANVIGKVALAAEKDRYKLAAEVLLSTGMVRGEALAEVDRLISVLKKAADDAGTARGKPTGVWAVVALASSPLASPMGYSAAAIGAGNAVVVMPSGSCPMPVFTLCKMFAEAGLPAGVLNVVADRLDRFVTDLSDDPDVSGVVASGCGKPIDDLMFVPVDEDLGFINEVKGMNPIVIASPGDMKKAARDVVESAFSYCGQHLYSTSKVIVLAQDERDFLRALAETVKDFTVDDPNEEGAKCGPLMSEATEKRFKKFLERESAFLISGGKRVMREYTRNGRYYTPAVFTGMEPEDDALYVDQGLPVLMVRTVPDIKAAVADLEETDCGLSVGVYSKDASVISRIKKFAEDEKVFVNQSSLSLEPAVRAEVANFQE